MSNSWWNRKTKKGENEQIIESKSVTIGDGRMVHSSSMSSITRQQVLTAQTTETRSVTVQQMESYPIASQSSINIFNTNPSSSTSNLQTYGKKDYKMNVSTDATPFTRDVLYKSSPPRSAFFSTPLTGASELSSINLNYNSPYAGSRLRSSSTSSPINSIGSAQRGRYDETPKNTDNRPQNSDADLKQKVTVKVIKSVKFYDDPQSKVPTYRTRSKRRGMLLLINNVKFVNVQEIRKGAELDEANLVQLFTQMGFEITKYKNLSKKDMESKIINFRKNSSLKRVDIGTVVIMSHGTGKETSDSTKVVCTDGELLQTKWIINQFDGDLCPQLSGKPKMFIFQCCRGDNRDVVQHDSVPIRAPRKLSDMLIAYSTVPGFVSHRDPQNGTWYIQAICKVFMEHAHDTDVESLLKIVDNMLSSVVSSMGSKQTSSFENRGFKTCYLHPQLHQ